VPVCMSLVWAGVRSAGTSKEACVCSSTTHGEEEELCRRLQTGRLGQEIINIALTHRVGLAGGASWQESRVTPELARYPDPVNTCCTADRSGLPGPAGSRIPLR